ncbi:Asp23/Gls24 family envelope stress response protein [Henriciella aquimarina]|uniref:hypothetical protein n=1 Tax=Henriciella aquimarina TaxID=545261 RepID=UPI000A02E021|nr:hypothetical protein [Henriciella aquimarina]
MQRRLIALLISGVAIVFAFGALTAIRWPSIMMFLSLFFHPDPALGFNNINWRELGFAYGAPYFLASLCYYAASVCVARRGKGSILWYAMGMAASIPVFYLVDFEAGWWRDPSGPEGMVAGGGVIVLMLGLAVVLLRHRKPRTVEEAVETGEGSVTLSQEQFEALMARGETKSGAEPIPAKPRRRQPMPAAIARQRAHFAAEGRRMRARRGR